MLTSMSCSQAGLVSMKESQHCSHTCHDVLLLVFVCLIRLAAWRKTSCLLSKPSVAVERWVCDHQHRANACTNAWLQRKLVDNLVTAEVAKLWLVQL